MNNLERLLREKLKLLKTDMMLYISPLSREDSAGFGIFEKIETRRRHIIRKSYLSLVMLCTFQFNEKYELWVPDLALSGNGLTYSLDQLCRQNIVYVGEEVRKGMESNSNPNYALAMVILARYLQNRKNR